MPFQRISIDCVGPLPCTERHNKYIVVVTDYLTRWPEAFAVENIQAPVIARLLVEEIMCRYGAPYQLLSDRGTNFMSQLVSETCKIINTRKLNTSSYHPQTNGLCERFNKTLADILSMYVNQRHNDWDVFIPFALWAYRTAVQTTTNETPFYLMYGRDPNLPIDCSLLPQPSAEDDLAVTQYKSELAKNLVFSRNI